MKPRIVIFNQVSLDGSVAGFDTDPALFYGILSELAPDIHLIGSITAVAGIDSSYDEIPDETEDDMKAPPAPEGEVPWVIVDTTGVLMGKLHLYRRSEYCSDPVVVVSKSTPGEYIQYLKERGYRIIESGEEKADLLTLPEKLVAEFGGEKIFVDSGGVLSSLLLEEGAVQEVNILISPTIVGGDFQKIFETIEVESPIKLTFKDAGMVEGGNIFLKYELEEEGEEE